MMHKTTGRLFFTSVAIFIRNRCLFQHFFSTQFYHSLVRIICQSIKRTRLSRLFLLTITQSIFSYYTTLRFQLNSHREKRALVPLFHETTQERTLPCQQEVDSLFRQIIHGRRPIFISYARCETIASIANAKRNSPRVSQPCVIFN